MPVPGHGVWVPSVNTALPEPSVKAERVFFARRRLSGTEMVIDAKDSRNGVRDHNSYMTLLFV